MKARLTIALAAGVLAAWCTGCSNSPGIVRAQSPAGPDAVQHAQYVGHGPEAVTPASYENCDPNAYGGAGCGDSSWHPTHYHWYTYEAPRNLVYPPQNVPASVIQYPYYTCKGPDDFFKKF